MTFRHAFANALLQFLWQGAAIGLAAGIALRTLRSQGAAARYAVCVVALLLCAAVPGVTTVTLVLRGETWTTADSTMLVSRLVDTTVGWPNAINGLWFDRVESFVLPVWLVGALLLSARLANAGRHVRTLRASAVDAPPDIVAAFLHAAGRLGVTSTARIALSHLVDGPSVIGWLRPLVLLPASVLTGLTPDQLETIIAHELAHIRRYDYVANVMQSVVETLFFYHPVVWWLSARARHERELCCDDTVLRFYDERVGYARALVCLERLRIAAPSMALGALDGPLGFRVRRMLGVAHRPPRSLAVPALTILCVIAACVGSVVDPQSEKRGEAVTSNIFVNGKDTIAVTFRTALGAARRDTEISSENLVGRRVAVIQIDDAVSDETRNRLELPIHLGELITKTTEREVELTVHAVSRGLRSEIAPLPSGQAVVRIIGDEPGSRTLAPVTRDSDRPSPRRK